MSEKIAEYGRISLHRTDREEESPLWTVRQETEPPEGTGGHALDMVTMNATEAGWMMATLEAELGVLRSEPDPPVFRGEAADVLADELGNLEARVRRAAGSESRHRGMAPEWWENVAGELLKLAAVAHRLSARPSRREQVQQLQDQVNEMGNQA